jgi:hypothetical protein
MVGENFSVEDLDTLSIHKLESDSLENNLKDISWEWVEVSPEDVILASNIRDIEAESVLELAMNIYEVGQLQPCIGDIVGQGEEKIIRLIAGQHRYHAIKYVEELSPKVQKMVNTGVLPYTTALLLAKLGKPEKDSQNGDYYSEQVRTAIFLISKRYTTKQAEKYLKKKSKENELAGPLFTNEVWEEIKTNGYKIAIKDQSSKEGRAAAGWFVRMNDAISILEQPHRAEFSEAIKKAMKELNISLGHFYSNLEEMGIKLD